ncbi:hypothetical protein GYMLUDRAFT_46820 [Collybiopsis luxurians FD-317 M1]|uniref:Uncharacterized protein n=1 Tax=Collybiopsis luxurians FD-317 M1 TaxID=944289 RepID=A0A0D0C3J4_9AGAR|nr:hypothetical protein GYMLUDRAFT_46820 [Collybiopsis luxurians FD-317 M1]
MRFPFVTPPSTRSENTHTLSRRRGGGGKGSGGGGKGGVGSSGSEGGSGGRSTSSSVSTSGTSRSATSYGGGGGKSVTIPAGQTFAGRTEGGATRDQVFGTSTYGSGYPGISGRGVSGRGFPFFFWPIVWGGAIGTGSTAYLHDTQEYGQPDNTTRPGGPMMISTFVSSASTSSNSTLSPTTFHVLADNTTVIALISAITSNCTSFNLNTTASSSNTTNPSALNASDPNAPKPEQAIEYYRASSVVLTLNGYNNSAALSDNDNATNTPLPSGIDTTLQDCLNQTIGAAVPLIDGARSVTSMGFEGVGLVSLFIVFIQLLAV